MVIEMRSQELRNAQVTQFDMSKISSDQKLYHTVRELASVKTLNQQVQHIQVQICNFSETMEQMNLRMHGRS